MKVGLVVHGYPPELVGGTENSVQALARALSGLGHDVFVVAGSMDYRDGLRRSLAEDIDPISGRPIRVHRIHRADLFFDHWHKSASPAAGQLFEQILREESPDVINVQHWIRLSRDLIARAARLEIPAVATLNDLWTTCLIAFRVRPDTRSFCDAILAPDPCAACAGILPPPTPWIGQEQLAERVLEFSADLRRELELAAIVVAPTAGHIRTAARFLAAPGALEAVRVLAPARESRSGILKTANIPATAFTSQAPLTLAYFGKWSELKGTDLLLDAIARTREPSRFRLWIAGSPSTPDYGSQLRADAQRLLPGEVVTFHGEYDKRELGAHAIATAHLFVTGTRAHESFGLVVDEALELGMGCLLPDLGAMGERAAAVQWATVYESGAADSLAALLDSLADNPARVAALRDGASRAIREGDFSARAPGLSALAEEMQSCLQDAIALGIPKAAAAALDQVDWTAREQRLSQESAAWDEALSKS